MSQQNYQHNQQGHAATEDTDSDNFEISCQLGTLSLSVSGGDEEWVRETFCEEWESRLQESENVSRALRDGTRSHY